MATQPTDDPPDEELDITPDIDDAKKATKQHTDVNITQESKGDSVIVIQKHQNIQSHYIHATTLTYDTLTIKLLLNTPISKKTSFYVYQCGEESGDYLGLIRIKKNKNEGDVEVDVEDMEEKTIKVAVYAKIHDKQPITNILHITIPEEQDDKPTLPNPISLATIKAFEGDEKDDNIYIEFDLPLNICGENISFEKNGMNDDDNKSEIICTRFNIEKSSIPTSFRITAITHINDKIYKSQPSDIISICYANLLFVMINYVHDNNEPCKIEFNKNTDFNAFKQIIINKLNIPKNEANNVQIGWIDNAKVRIINKKNFKTVLDVINISQSLEKVVTKLCAGFKPDIPIISKIDSSVDGELNIELQETFNNINSIYYYDTESENKEDEIELKPNTTKDLKMKINGIKPYGKYRIRVCAKNKINQSDWCVWSEYIQQIKPEEESEFGGKEKLKYFIQITEITSEDFMVRLDVLEMNVKKRKYMVKDITNDKNIIDLGTLNINRKQLSGECMVDIERNHYEYNIAIYDKVSNKQ
eukprot:212206_1